MDPEYVRRQREKFYSAQEKGRQQSQASTVTQIDETPDDIEIMEFDEHTKDVWSPMKTHQQPQQTLTSTPHKSDDVTLSDEALARKLMEEEDLKFAAYLGNTAKQQHQAASRRSSRPRAPVDPTRLHHIDLVSPEKSSQLPLVSDEPSTSRRRLPPSLSAWEFTDATPVEHDPHLIPHHDSFTNDSTLNDEALALALQEDFAGRSLRRTPAFPGSNSKMDSNLSVSDEFYARALQEEELQASVATASDFSRSFRFLDGTSPAPDRTSFRSRARRRHSRDLPVSGQHIRLDSYEDLLKLDEINGVVKKGLSQAQIRLLPLVPFLKGERSEDECRCCICYEDFHTGENVMMLPCFHAYHPKCLTPWLSDNKICPICREEIKA